MLNNTLEFKFRYVQNGQARGLRASKGTATAEAITLGTETIPYESILDTTTRDNRLILILAVDTSLGEQGRKYLVDGQALILHLNKLPALDLEKYIDRQASAVAAANHRRTLKKEGKEDLFRTAICPQCQATINLTELSKTPYTYCRYCETIFDSSLTIVSDGDLYQICSECNMFDRVRGYTLFNFYFLLIVYGFSSRRVHLCDTCALKASNRALLQNLIFILGVPPALWMRIKAMTGRDANFKELATANKLARAGNYQAADEIFQNLQQRLPNHPGLLLNQGRGHILGQDIQGGYEYLTQSITSCANYGPTVHLLQQLHQAAQKSQ